MHEAGGVCQAVSSGNNPIVVSRRAAHPFTLRLGRTRPDLALQDLSCHCDHGIDCRGRFPGCRWRQEDRAGPGARVPLSTSVSCSGDDILNLRSHLALAVVCVMSSLAVCRWQRRRSIPADNEALRLFKCSNSDIVLCTYPKMIAVRWALTRIFRKPLANVGDHV